VRGSLFSALGVVIALSACGGRTDEASHADGSAESAISCTGLPKYVPGKYGLATSGTRSPACAGARQLGWKAGAVGSVCTSPLDCQPACCACQAGSDFTSLASACFNGKCTAPEEACCAVAGTPTRSCGYVDSGP
jgi:hypothetical protein